jgi:hypothetical protein
MTYNFDPERWYEDQTRRLDLLRERGDLSVEEYRQALAELDQRLEAMMRRLDGTFQVTPVQRADT